MNISEEKLYECPECGLHFTDEATAKKCEAWCKQHKSCNLDIAKQSIEGQDTHA